MDWGRELAGEEGVIWRGGVIHGRAKGGEKGTNRTGNLAIELLRYLVVPKDTVHVGYNCMLRRGRDKVDQ